MSTVMNLQSATNTANTSNDSSSITIRPIEQKDDDKCAQLIVDVLIDFNALGDLTVNDYADLTKTFESPNSFFVAALDDDDEIVGTIGLDAHLNDDDTFPRDTIELCKFYVKCRGKGIGRQLLQRAIDTARQQGFKKVYLESMPELDIAIRMYEKFGFRRRAKQGPKCCVCSVFMEYDL